MTTLRQGEKIALKGARVTVTPLDATWVPRIRDHLIGVATQRETTTYGRLKRALGLPHAVNGLGRLLDLVAEDCRRRGEPPLDAVVVTAATGEVGSDHAGDAASERTAVYQHWS